MSSRIGDHIPPISLLKEAGFEEGDFLPLYNFNPNSDRYISTTATTYTRNLSFSFIQCVWNELFPADVTTHVFGSVMVTIGADETLSLRIYNIQDGETVGEITGITTNGIQTIDVDYEPPTVGSRTRFAWEWKESPGANATDLEDAFISLGVKL